MIYRVAVFVCVVAFCTIGAKAQCIPDPVYVIDLANSTLSWDASTNCPTTYYIVNIHSNGILEYVYQANTTTLNVSFLSYCRTYTFYVTAVADHVIGLESIYETTVPLPVATNITITNFTGAAIDDDVLLQWHVNPDHIYCVDSYKLLLWTEDAAVPQEIDTTQNGYYILGVAKCTSFEIEVSVQYLAQEHPVAKFNYTVPSATNPPTLVTVRQDSLTINTTWSLQSYYLNRCNVSALHVNGTHFNTTISILDLPSRPHIELNIPGLRANSMYFFNVTTENEAGISKPYLVAVQTLPISPNSELDEDSYNT